VALIVEDGTGLANAESFASVAEASAYHTSIGNSAWAALASDTVREQLLRKATAYMLQRYRPRWAGWRKTSTQALDWPRYDVPIKDAPILYGGSPSYYDDASVPQTVKNACASLALRAATATLLADESRTVSSETVGPISVTYDAYSGQAVRYKEIDTMLSPYFKTSGGQVPMVRA
jgi:hypothetical protein